MIIGITGTKANGTRFGEGSGKTVLGLAIMYHLLKDEYKNEVNFLAFIKCFKQKAFRDYYTLDKFITPVTFVSDSITLKEMLMPMLRCSEEDLYNTDYLVRPIKNLKTNFIMLNGKRYKAIPDAAKANNFITKRNANGSNKWSVKSGYSTPLTLLEDMKEHFNTAVSPCTILSNRIQELRHKSAIIYVDLDNFYTFNLIKNLGGATIIVDNPNKKGGNRGTVANQIFAKNEFDYRVNNNSDIENLYREALIITQDLLNGI